MLAGHAKHEREVSRWVLAEFKKVGEPWLSIATLLWGNILTCAVCGLTTETDSQNQTKGLERQTQTNKNKQIIPQFHLFVAQATPDKVSPS
jgi:hypothetical protein